jgi:hypothetical protein
MIGTIDEAKGKAKPVSPTALAKPESIVSKSGLKDTDGLLAQATSGLQPKVGAKPPPKLEHAGSFHES